MRRYHFLSNDDVYKAINRLRDAFLAAKNGSEVEEIINAILTQDEKLKIGRRVLIAECLNTGLTIEEIAQSLKVGKTTITSVAKNLEIHTTGFKLLKQRKDKVEKRYQSKRYRKVGGSTKVFKSKVYTGFKRKDVER